MNEYEFLLEDRIAKIQSVVLTQGEEKFYISFSGGKDSTILSHLVDIAIPGNKIPRVFINTGIEYASIVKFVERERERDGRIEIIKPSRNIKQILETYGYPFKSKEHSLKLGEYKKGSRAKSVIYYKTMTGKSRFSCPDILKYQYDDSFDLHVSDKCCYKLKKEPIKKWEKENNRFIAITGMLAEEGGQRINLSCIITRNNTVVKFHPLSVVSGNWEDWFIEKFKVELCELYYPPYSFKRTGCKGCPFALTLQDQLTTLGMYFPNERKQCENIWKPVYEEYRRLNYRLKKDEQLRLF